MAPYGSHPVEQDVMLLGGPAWPLPAVAEADDWPGVAGDCHALRPAPGDDAPVVRAMDDEDWGYGNEAC
jgi:hypothetical protein